MKLYPVLLKLPQHPCMLQKIRCFVCTSILITQGTFDMEIAISMPHVIHSLSSPSHSIHYKLAPKKATLVWTGGTIYSGIYLKITRAP